MNAPFAYPFTKSDRETQLLTRIGELSIRLAKAEGERDELMHVFGLASVPAWPELGLTPHQARLLNALLHGLVLTKEQLLFAMHRRETLVDPKITDVMICKMRPKLAPHGIVIETVWGRGHRLTEESKRKLKEMS